MKYCTGIYKFMLERMLEFHCCHSYAFPKYLVIGKPSLLHKQPQLIHVHIWFG
uniref:Ovule protein n=1 Tax=Heterorhabditis bacteriophora TaxID=37862 RepID=A0A1I7WGH3_HETBA